MQMTPGQSSGRSGGASRLAAIVLLALVAALGSMGCDLAAKVCEQCECDEAERHEAEHHDADGHECCLTECVCGFAAVEREDAPRHGAVPALSASTVARHPAAPAARVGAAEPPLPTGVPPPLFLLHVSFLI